MNWLQVFELSLVVQSVRIFGFHPEDPGSIPGGGATFCSQPLFCTACQSNGQVVMKTQFMRKTREESNILGENFVQNWLA